MPTKKKTARKTPDHRFRAIYDRDVAWDEDTANELLTLPKGLNIQSAQPCDLRCRPSGHPLAVEGSRLRVDLRHNAPLNLELNREN